MTDARALAEETARASYGRLVAWLAARSGDIAAAEDAFAAALAAWPETGPPRSPEAWLLAAARRRMIDGARRRRTAKAGEAAILMAVEEAEALADAAPFADERLKLLFICAHPAIDAGMHAPLMLQTVLGLDAARIASAFLVAPSAMAQRLVRAKKKIAEARIRFETPDTEDLPARAGAVLDAIYAAFGVGYDGDGADEAAGEAAGLMNEAAFLAGLVATLLPDDAVALGLEALILHTGARREARRAGGRYVPFDQQDLALWDGAAIAQAEAALARAAALRRPGRFQLEAAIQSAHAARRLHGADTRADVVALYERLMALAPSTGAQIGHGAALLAAGRAADALAVLDAVDPARVAAHQPYWAARAHVLSALAGTDPLRRAEAAAAFERAIGLCADPAARLYLAASAASTGRPSSL